MSTVAIPTIQPLTTRDAVELELGVTDQDGVLDALILRASATVETLCGRRFGLQTVRETLRNDPHGGPLLPSRWPVVAVLALAVDGRDVDPDEVSIDGGMFARAGGWGRSAVVEYTAGYVLPGEEGRTLPYDVEQAVIELVRDAWFTRRRDPGIRSEAVEGVGSTSFFEQRAVSAITDRLSSYRLPVAF